jgi:ABC-2 type transport system permease protein
MKGERPMNEAELRNRPIGPTTMNPMKGVFATMRSAVLEATSNRRALVFQMTVMILNDLAWIGFWTIFFHRAGAVRGWDLEKVILLHCVLTAAGGLVLGLLANTRNIATLAMNGGLDSVLTLPVRPLPNLLVRRVEPTNFGDVIFGVALFAFAGHPTSLRVLTFILCVIGSTIVLASFLILVSSLSFYSGRTDGAELGFNAILLVSSYPIDIFSGALKTAFFTLVPAAFIASVPAGLINHFNPTVAFEFVLAALIFATLASLTFRSALRHYTSASTWTRA